MKIFMYILACSFCFLMVSCDSKETMDEWECGTHNGKTLWTGPKGGCYYYNSNGNKTYVDRSECNC